MHGQHHHASFAESNNCSQDVAQLPSLEGVLHALRSRSATPSTAMPRTSEDPIQSRCARTGTRTKRVGMVTGALKSKIDAVWNDFWAGGISNPLEVMEQL